MSNLAWPRGIPFTYVVRARSEDRKRLIDHYKSKFKTRWSEMTSSGFGVESPQQAADVGPNLRVFDERTSNESVLNHLRMILSQGERDVASLVGQNIDNGSQPPCVDRVHEPSGGANAVQSNQDQEDGTFIDSTDVEDIRRVTRVEEEGPSGTGNDLVPTSLRGRRGRPRKRKRGRPAKEKN